MTNLTIEKGWYTYFIDINFFITSSVCVLEYLPLFFFFYVYLLCFILFLICEYVGVCYREIKR